MNNTRMAVCVVECGNSEYVIFQDERGYSRIAVYQDEPGADDMFLGTSLDDVVSFLWEMNDISGGQVEVIDGQDWIEEVLGCEYPSEEHACLADESVEVNEDSMPVAPINDNGIIAGGVIEGGDEEIKGKEARRD